MALPIFTVPREVRDKIYDNVISLARSDRPARFADCRALLLVNRLIYEETNDFLHRKHNFVLVGLASDNNDDWWMLLRKHWPTQLWFDNRRPNSFTMSSNITYVKLQSRHYEKRDMLTVVVPGAEYWEYFCGELARCGLVSRQPSSFLRQHPMRSWRLSINFKHQPADLAVKRRIQKEVLDPLQDHWWAFWNVNIKRAADEALVEHTVACVKGKKWSSSEAFIAELKDHLDTGDIAYAQGHVDEAVRSWERGLLRCSIAEKTKDVVTFISDLAQNNQSVEFYNTYADLCGCLGANLGESYLKIAAKMGHMHEKEYWAAKTQEVLLLGHRPGVFDETTRMRVQTLMGWACDLLGDDQSTERWLGGAYELFKVVDGQRVLDELPPPIGRSGEVARARLVSGWFERLRSLEMYMGREIAEDVDVVAAFDVSDWF